MKAYVFDILGDWKAALGHVINLKLRAKFAGTAKVR